MHYSAAEIISCRIGADGTPDYNMTIPTLLARYLPTGLLGIGFTALMASFMSGMAGNVTAFNTVWTYDIYQSYIAPGKSDHALSLDGPHGDGVRHPRQHRLRLSGVEVQQHHGHAAACVRLRERAAVCDFPARHVLAARDRSRRVLRIARRHVGRGSFPWACACRRRVPGIKGGWIAHANSSSTATWARTSRWRSSPGRPASC